LLPTSKEENKAYGLFNVAASGSVSRYEYATEIVREAKLQNWSIRLIEKNIIPIKTDRSSTITVRPKYSVLNTDKICGLLGYKFPEWHLTIKGFISDLGRV
jgi:dTDP-4-dehydrorhamnose reductase